MNLIVSYCFKVHAWQQLEICWIDLASCTRFQDVSEIYSDAPDIVCVLFLSIVLSCRSGFCKESRDSCFVNSY